jgi:DNA-binding CsgD family transcriptional regulator
MRYQGDYERAKAYYEESLSLSRELSIDRYIPILLSNLSQVALRQGDLSQATALCTQSLTLAREAGYQHPITLSLFALAAIAAVAGQPQRAARLFAAAQTLLTILGASLEPADRAESERNLATIRTRLDEKALAAAWAEGQAMTLDQAVAYALNPLPVPEPTSPKPEPPPPAEPAPAAPPLAPIPALAELTTRELELLRLVALGLTNAEIAEKLIISQRTVNSHLTSIYSKLGLTSRSAVMRFAMEHKLV